MTLTPPPTTFRLDMERRRFLATTIAGFLAAPLAAEAQEAGKVYGSASSLVTAKYGRISVSDR